MERKIKSRLIWWLRAFITLLLLYLVFQIVSVEKIISAIENADIFLVLIAVSLTPIHIILQSVKWRVLVRQLNVDFTLYNSIRSVIFGITIGIVTPGQLGEFVGRAVSAENISKSSLVGLAITDKIQNMIILALGGLTTYIIFAFGFSILTVVSSLLISFVLISIAMSLPRISSLFLRFIPEELKKPWLLNSFSAVKGISSRVLLISIVFSCIFYLVVLVQMHLLLNSFLDVPLESTLFGYATMMFVKALLPISFGDIGIRELSAMYFFSLQGVPHEPVFNASALLFFLNIALPSVLGSFLVPRFERFILEAIERSRQ